ncbi:MAG: Lysozyme inhibitor LprI, partial [Acidimicrobiaceae bacterium]
PALDRAFAQVMAALPPDRAPLLSESQQAWEHYVTVDCDLAGRVAEGGQDQLLFLLGCTVEHNIRRIDDLIGNAPQVFNSSSS